MKRLRFALQSISHARNVLEVSHTLVEEDSVSPLYCTSWTCSLALCQAATGKKGLTKVAVRRGARLGRSQAHASLANSSSYMCKF